MKQPFLPPEGTRIRLLSMPEDPDPVPSGSTGTVISATWLDDWTQIMVNWDNGRSLNLSVPPDTYEILRS